MIRRNLAEFAAVCAFVAPDGRLHPWFGRQLLPLYHPGLLARKNRSVAQQLEDIACLKTVLGESPSSGARQ